LKTVLFVCTANICRSPMAGAVFDALAEDGTLPFRAQSAGTVVLEGRAMAPNTLAALEEAEIYPGPTAPDRWARLCSKGPSWCSR
jgi:protein arginine phosphatase